MYYVVTFLGHFNLCKPFFHSKILVTCFRCMYYRAIGSLKYSGGLAEIEKLPMAQILLLFHPKSGGAINPPPSFFPTALYWVSNYLQETLDAFPSWDWIFLSHQLPNSHFVLMPHNDAQFEKVHQKEYFYFHAPSNLLQFEKETEKEMLKNIYYSCKNGILLSKLFWPTVRKNCSNEWEKLLKFEAEGRECAKCFSH